MDSNIVLNHAKCKKYIMVEVVTLFSYYQQDNNSEISQETMSEAIKNYFNRCATLRFAGVIHTILNKFKPKFPQENRLKYHEQLTKSYALWVKQQKCPSCDRQMPQKGKDLDLFMRPSKWGVDTYMIAPRSKKDLPDSLSRIRQVFAQFQQKCQKYLPKEKELLILQQDTKRDQIDQDNEDNQDDILVNKEHIELKREENPSLKKEVQDFSMNDEGEEEKLKKQKMKQKKTKKERQKQEKKHKNAKGVSQILEMIEQQSS